MPLNNKQKYPHMYLSMNLSIYFRVLVYIYIYKYVYIERECRSKIWNNFKTFSSSDFDGKKTRQI